MKKFLIIFLIILFIALLILANKSLYNNDNENTNITLSGNEKNLQENKTNESEINTVNSNEQEIENNDELTFENQESGSVIEAVNDTKEDNKEDFSEELVIESSGENKEKSIQERLAEINNMSASKAEILFLDEQSFNEKVLNSSEKTIVDFYADWCEPCKYLAPIYEQVANENLDIPFFEVNVDEVDSLANKYRVYNIPTIILFEKGVEKDRIIGLPTKEDLVNFINQ